MSLSSVILQTDRLVLRPFDMTDVAAVTRLLQDVEISRNTLRIPHPYSESDAREWIAIHTEERVAGTDLSLAVTLADGRLIGAGGLTLNAENARAELGYWIGKEFWNRGYASEAARSLVGYAFSTLGIHRVFAGHFGSNPASGRVLQHIGMRLEGCRRQHTLKNDIFEDRIDYGVLKQDWGAWNREPEMESV